MEQKISTITKEQLIADGWIMIEDVHDPVKAEKIISKPTDDDELGPMSLVLHTYYNAPQFALNMPDGCMLQINPACIEDLQKFESLILSWEPNY